MANTTIQEQQRVDQCMQLFITAYNTYGEQWKDQIRKNDHSDMCIRDEYNTYSFFGCRIKNYGFLGVEPFYKMIVLRKTPDNEDLPPLTAQEMKLCCKHLTQLFGLSFYWENKNYYGPNGNPIYNYRLFYFFPQKRNISNADMKMIFDMGQFIKECKEKKKIEQDNKIQKWKEIHHDQIETEQTEALRLFNIAFDKYGQCWKDNMKKIPAPWECVNSRFWNTEHKLFPGLAKFYNYFESLHVIVQIEIKEAILKQYDLLIDSTRWEHGGGGTLFFIDH